MGDYFKLWRRKIGVVTLLMACVFMVAWMRSLIATDSVTLPFKNQSGTDTIIVTRAGMVDILLRKASEVPGQKGRVQSRFPIPIMLIAIPLALLSAWLLLSKPRLANNPEK